MTLDDTADMHGSRAFSRFKRFFGDSAETCPRLTVRATRFRGMACGSWTPESKGGAPAVVARLGNKTNPGQKCYTVSGFQGGGVNRVTWEHGSRRSMGSTASASGSVCVKLRTSAVASVRGRGGRRPAPGVYRRRSPGDGGGGPVGEDRFRPGRGFHTVRPLLEQANARHSRWRASVSVCGGRLRPPSLARRIEDPLFPVSRRCDESIRMLVLFGSGRG